MPSYVQHPETGQLIPLSEVDWPRYRTNLRSAQIMPDIEPFVSPIDQTIISSRSALRAHNKRHDVVNVKEFDGHFEEVAKTKLAIAEGRHKPTRDDRLKDVIAAVDKVKSGYKPKKEYEDG